LKLVVLDAGDDDDEVVVSATLIDDDNLSLFMSKLLILNRLVNFAVSAGSHATNRPPLSAFDGLVVSNSIERTADGGCGCIRFVGSGNFRRSHPTG
jgi:hypothetical protein